MTIQLPIYSLKFCSFLLLLIIQQSNAGCPIVVTPSRFSEGGEVELTISGCGFSKNQFNFGKGNEHIGNKITLIAYDHTAPCNVLKDGSHETQIMCLTTKMRRFRWYKVKIEVDGINMYNKFIVKTNYDHALLREVYPSSGEPNTVVRIKGRLITEIVNMTVEANQFGGTERISRIYSTGQLCNPLIPDSDDYYGIKVNSHRDGYIECMIEGNYVGYQNLSFIITGRYGRSVPLIEAYHLSRTNKPYMFMSYPVIESISPLTIGTLGGAEITIKGKFNPSEPKVYFGDKKCKPLPPYSNREIRCVINDELPTTHDVYEGNSGVTIESWFTSTKIADFNYPLNGEDYKQTTSSTFYWKVPSSGSVIIRVRGFFVALQDGDYEFFTNKIAQIKFGKEEKLYNTTGRRTLKKNEKILIEVVTTEKEGQMSVKVFAVVYTSAHMKIVNDEIQQIELKSKTSPEKQKMEFTPGSATSAGKPEKQKVVITGSGSYQLCIYHACTDLLSPEMQFPILQRKITEHAVLKDSVKVTGMSTEYIVEFQNSFGNAPILEVKNIPLSKVSGTVSTVQDGEPPSDNFRLSLDGAVSLTTVSMSNLTYTVEEALTSLFYENCPKSVSPTSGNFKDFETKTRPAHPVFCGKAHGYNSEIFYNGILLTSNPYLCFAYRSMKSLTVKVKANNANHNYEYEFSFSDKWQYECVSLVKFVNKYNKASYVYLNSIYFKGYVDNVYVGRMALAQENSDVMSMRTSKPFKVQKFAVSVTDKVTTITINPGGDYHGFQLLSVAGGNGNWANGAKVSTTRISKSSVPISGTYSLKYKDHVIKGLAWNEVLTKDRLKAFPDTGEIGVTQEITPVSVKTVFTLHFGGSKSKFEIVDANFAGDIEETKAQVVTEGHALLSPIPNDMIQSAHHKPQIWIQQDGIVAYSCNATFNFTTDAELNPTLTGVTDINDNSVNGQLSATGTKFNEDATKTQLVFKGNDADDEYYCKGETGSTTQFNCKSSYLPFGSYTVTLVNLDVGKAPKTVSHVRNPKPLKVIPETASKIGGTLISINGEGFASISVTVVKIAGKICNIIDFTRSKIVCILPAKDASAAFQATVTVSQYGTNAELKDGFTYDDTASPIIESITPNSNLHVTGGKEIQISGDHFTDKVSGVVVKVGNVSVSPSNVTTKLITFKSPKMKPGQYEVTVHITQAGICKSTTKLQYVLKVNGLLPAFSSIAGGSMVTINGAGFGTDSSKLCVKFDDISCQVKQVKDTEIKCIAGCSAKVHTISLIEDTKRGIGWNTTSISVYVGDYVQWVWQGEYYINISQAVSLTNMTIDESKPNSGSPKINAHFKQRFNKIAQYAFISQIPGGKVVIVVNVMQHPGLTTKLSVRLSEIDADQINSGQTISASCLQTDCPAEKKVAYTNNESKQFHFIYHPCLTYKITSVQPYNGFVNSQNTFTVALDPVPPNSCVSTVFLNFVTKTDQSNVDCKTTATQNEKITCKVSSDSIALVAPFTPGSIKVKIGNQGFEALATTKVDLHTLPVIVSISPTSGSEYGETELSILGSSFPDEKQLESITIAGKECKRMSVTRNKIVCLTAKAGDVKSGPVVMKLVKQTKEVDCVSCDFKYITSQMPVSSCTGAGDVKGPFSLSIKGSGFPSDKSKIKLQLVAKDDINGKSINDACLITSISDKTLIEADCSALPVGSFLIKMVDTALGALPVVSNIDSCNINSVLSINSINPSSGSLGGGTLITISGNGFVPSSTTVTIGTTNCAVKNVTFSQIKCESATSKTAGSQPVTVTANGKKVSNVNFDYNSSKSPKVTSANPNTVSEGVLLKLTGTNFGIQKGAVHVSLCLSALQCFSCPVKTVTSTEIGCTVPGLIPGTYSFKVIIDELGMADVSSIQVKAEIAVSSIDKSEGSFAGNQLITVTGSGFQKDITTVTLCGSNCTDVIAESTKLLNCRTPRDFTTQTSGDKQCDLIVQNGATSTNQATLASAYTFKQSLTAKITSVEPLIGGTAGGTIVTINGEEFHSTDVKVMIDGSECVIKENSATKIKCRTSAHKKSGKFLVELYNSKNGLARGDFKFYYIDRWSSVFTWNGSSLPREGEMVVVPEGMTLLLDIERTPILSMLLINGGRLIFDRKQPNVELNAQYVLINNGGSLEIGTEDDPFLNKARVVLHGNLRSKELPIYGVKMIAVRNGTIDIHGKYVNVPWTKLAKTVTAGTDTIEVTHPVDWKVGDSIAISSTGHRHSQKETEKHVIKEIKTGNKIIVLEKPLAYKKFGGLNIEIPSSIKMTEPVVLAAEVGLLTRNIVIQGSREIKYDKKIEACPDDFDAGQFAVQTCFQGKFGEEMGSDEFGAHIIAHPAKLNSKAAVMRLSGVEFTHVGQAFRLGRYPVHFHICGDMSGSYVKRISVHHSFNRALVIHGTHNVLIDSSVFYDIKGGALFLEDGIEHGNVFQYNYIVKVIMSTSLLNDDVTPASFWGTNPNNTFIHNAAAAGTHFGYWYRMHNHPQKSSYDPNICPIKHPLGKFFNNTAHSFGWFGLWIFPDWFPTADGGCTSTDYNDLSVFSEFTVWNSEKGVECVNCGSVQFDKIVAINNEHAGIEGKTIANTIHYSKTKGPVYKNSLIIGHEPSLGDDKTQCTWGGIILPWNNGLTISNVVFRNFETKTCSAVKSRDLLNTCCNGCGGYNYHFENIKFDKAPNKVGYRWHSEFVIEDKDGTFTEKAPKSIVVASLPIYDPAICVEDSNGGAFSVGRRAAICQPDKVKFQRLAINSPQASLSNRDLNISTIINGKLHSMIAAYKDVRLSFGTGSMVSLPVNKTYYINWVSVPTLSNLTYSVVMDQIEPNWLVICHKLSKTPDVLVNGNKTDRDFNYETDPHLTWTYNNETNEFCYLSKSGSPMTITVYKCYFIGCSVPTGKDHEQVVPTNIVKWTDNEPPNGCEISAKDYVKATFSYSDKCPQLVVRGYLEFIPPETENKTTLLISKVIKVIGGKIFAGTNKSPYTGNLNIHLDGEFNDPEHPPISGPPIGNKALAVFGELKLFGKPVTKPWTHLAKTAKLGTNKLYLNETVSWKVGDEIVVTTTSFNFMNNEYFKIKSLSDSGSTIELDGILKYDHFVFDAPTKDNKTIRLAAEVGLLTRNIVIRSHNLKTSDYHSFGGRIFVSKMVENFVVYTGSVQLSNIELQNMGQFGFLQKLDARYALALMGLGNNNDTNYIENCVCSRAYSPCFGIYGTNGVSIKGNIVYKTAGEGMIVEGKSHKVIGNLIAEAYWVGGYYRPSDGPGAAIGGVEWTGALDIRGITSDTVIENNVIASSQLTGIYMGHIECTDTSIVMRNNVIHSAMMGIRVFYRYSVAFDKCVRISGATIYRAHDYGIYYQFSASLKVSDVILVENGIGIIGMIFAPANQQHIVANKLFSVESSVIGGYSSELPCNDNIAGNQRGGSSKSGTYRSPYNGPIGMLLGVFMSKSTRYPTRPFADITSYNTLSGRTVINDVTFVNYDEICTGKKGVALSTHHKILDGQLPTFLSKVNFVNTSKDSYYYNHRPDVEDVTFALCGDMECDGLKKALIHDLDGSLIEKAGSIFSESEWQWDKDPRRGIGYNRVPKILGTEAEIKAKYPNQGIERKPGCKYNSVWQCYSCPGVKYEMVTVESMDADHETRRLAPTIVASDQPSNNYIDLINGPAEHGWCSGYACGERVSTFQTIMARGGKYLVYFSSTAPHKLRLFLNNPEKESGVRVAVHLDGTGRYDVYRNNSYVKPVNGYYKNEKLLLYESEDKYKTDVDNGNAGANYYDGENKLLYMKVKYRDFIESRLKPVVVLGFNIPAMTVKEFFGTKIVKNLALFLGIPADKVRVVNVIPETPGRRRRKRAATGIRVELQIGYSSPAEGSPAPSAEETTKLFNEMKNMSDIIVAGVQTGTMTAAVGVPISKVQMAVPSETITSKATTQSTAIQIPEKYKAKIVGTQVEGQVMEIQVEALDSDGNHVTMMGSSKLKYSAELKIIDKSTSALEFSSTAEFSNTDGWAKFKNIILNYIPKGYEAKIKVNRTSENGTDEQGDLSMDFEVKLRELELKLNCTIDGDATKSLVIINSNSVLVGATLIDSSTKKSANNLIWNSHRWSVALQICDQKQQTSAYSDWGSSPKNVAVEGGTSYIKPAALKLFKIGAYRLCGQAKPTSHPNRLQYYNIRGVCPNQLVVRASGYVAPKQENQKQVSIIFPKAVYANVASKLKMFETSLFNRIHFDLLVKHDKVLSHNYKIVKGSVVSNFKVFGSSSSDVDAFTDEMGELIYGGKFVLKFDGIDYTAEKMTVNDVEFVSKEQEDRTLLYIILGVAFSILIIIIVAIVCWICLRRSSKITNDATNAVGQKY